MHRRAELEGNLRRKPNPKGAQAGARKRSEESDEAIVAGEMRRRAIARREGAAGTATPPARYNAEPVTSFKVEKDLVL